METLQNALHFPTTFAFQPLYKTFQHILTAMLEHACDTTILRTKYLSVYKLHKLFLHKTKMLIYFYIDKTKSISCILLIN